MPFPGKDIEGAKRAALTLYILGLMVTATFAVLYVYKPALCVHLNFKVYDTLLRSIHSHQTTSVPVIVDIDERSLTEYGQWPWPRYRVARLVEMIRQMGAASIAMDMVFAERDRTSLSILKTEIMRDLGIHLPCADDFGAPADNDAILAEVLARGSIILGYEFVFGSGASGVEEGPDWYSPPAMNPG